MPLILIPTGLGVLLLAIILISRRKIIMKSRVRHPLKPRLVTKKQGNKGEEVYCRTCGGEIEGLFVFCPYCGANRTDKKRSKTT